ncbi:MAG: hypothetical protein ACJAUR_000659, partial [Ulvibacter sp.]
MKIPSYYSLLALFIILSSCEPNSLELEELEGNTSSLASLSVGDIESLVVPEGHDLRPLKLQNTNIRLSENSRADVVKVKIY